MKLNELIKTQELYTAYRELPNENYSVLEVEKSEGRIKIAQADLGRYRTPAELVDHLEWIKEMILAGRWV